MTRSSIETEHTRACIQRALGSFEEANAIREFRDDLEREGAMARMVLGFLLDITDTHSFAGWESDVLATVRDWWKGSPTGSGKGSGKGIGNPSGEGSSKGSVGRIVALGTAIVESSRDLSRDRHGVTNAAVTPLRPVQPQQNSDGVGGAPVGSGEACCDDVMDGSHPWDEVTGQ